MRVLELNTVRRHRPTLEAPSELRYERFIELHVTECTEDQELQFGRDVRAMVRDYQGRIVELNTQFDGSADVIVRFTLPTLRAVAQFTLWLADVCQEKE